MISILFLALFSEMNNKYFIALASPHQFTKGEVWAHKTNLIPTLVIEVPVRCQESEQS